MRDRIVCVGDVIDDVIVMPEGPVRDDTDTWSTIRFRPGGSAANTAAWLAHVGAAVDLVACVGAADVARHTEALPGVRSHLSTDAELPTGTIIVIVDGQKRHMLTERGANARLDPAAVTDAVLATARVLHVTGHTLRNEHGLGDLIARARAAGVAVCAAPGSAGLIADLGASTVASALAGATILMGSLEEGRLLTGLDGATEIAQALGVEIAVLTRGAEGVLVVTDGAVHEVPAVAAREVVDPTGAGDAFTAGFLASWVEDGDPVAAARAGVRVAAEAVARVGARP